MLKKPKTKARAKKAAPPKTLCAQVFALCAGYNFPVDYTQAKGRETVTLTPRNTFAEKIVVSTEVFDANETLVSIYRITGGEKYVSLDFVSNNSGRTESAALAIIKSELKRYC